MKQIDILNMGQHHIVFISSILNIFSCFSVNIENNKKYKNKKYRK